MRLFRTKSTLVFSLFLSLSLLLSFFWGLDDQTTTLTTDRQKKVFFWILVVHRSIDRIESMVWYGTTLGHCVWNSLSHYSSKLFGGKQHTQKKKKKTETIPVRGRQNQIIIQKRVDSLILFLSKNKSLPRWAFE